MVCAGPGRQRPGFGGMISPVQASPASCCRLPGLQLDCARGSLLKMLKLERNARLRAKEERDGCSHRQAL